MANGKEAGSVTPDELLSLDEFKRRFRLGDAALRTMRRKGLKLKQVGRSKFVSGREFIRYVDSVGKDG